MKSIRPGRLGDRQNPEETSIIFYFSYGIPFRGRFFYLKFLALACLPKKRAPYPKSGAYSSDDRIVRMKAFSYVRIFLVCTG
jgi:hypothetical protein